MRFVDVHRLSCCRPGQVVKLTIGSLCINYPKRSPQIHGYYRSLTGFHSVRGKHLRTKAGCFFQPDGLETARIGRYQELSYTPFERC